MTRSWNWFTKEEIDAWPENHKKCRKCFQVKPFSAFHKNDNGKQLFGLASDCKDCRKEKSKSDWEKNKNNIKGNMIHRAKGRAKKIGVPFDITESDIEIPERCPVFDKPFILGDQDWTYSIDRIVPSLGYVSGNVVIVSNKANVIKNNATAEEVLLVGNFYKNLSK